jgi:hypothetical protein
MKATKVKVCTFLGLHAIVVSVLEREETEVAFCFLSSSVEVPVVKFISV